MVWDIASRIASDERSRGFGVALCAGAKCSVWVEGLDVWIRGTADRNFVVI